MQFNDVTRLAYFVLRTYWATLFSLFFSVRHFVILVKRREARVTFRIIQNTWSILIWWYNFNDIWKVRVLEFQIIILLTYQSLFHCPKSWVWILSKIENLYKTYWIMLVRNNKKRGGCCRGKSPFSRRAAKATSSQRGGPAFLCTISLFNT